MPDLNLTQSEADELIAMDKHCVDDKPVDYPGLGGRVTVPVTSRNRRENFLLDVTRGRIDLLRGKYQNRARQVVILVRLDFGGAPHRNPDDAVIACPHLHVYRAGFGDKWAEPVPREAFPNPDDLWQTLHDFMRYCNITRPPLFERGLFT